MRVKYSGVQVPYTGHSFTGDVRIKGLLVHVDVYSSAVRSERRAMEFAFGIFLMRGVKLVWVHWKGR